MRSHLLLILICATLTVSMPAIAQTQPTVPTTNPAELIKALITPTTTTAPVVDQTSPRAVQRTLTIAMDQGDMEAIKTITHPTTDPERRLRDLMADMSGAMAQLREASVTIYGEEGAVALLGDSGATQMQLDAINRATEKINDDNTATLAIEGMAEPLQYVLIDGKWTVSMAGAIPADAAPADVEAKLENFANNVTIIREVAKDVAAGRYRTAQDVRQVIYSRMALKKPTPATTQAKE